MTHFLTLDDWDSDPPRAEVQQIGRWTYKVSVIHGICSWGPGGYGWHVFGRRRAARKAVRVLRLYLRDQLRRSEVVSIESGDPGLAWREP